VRSTDWHNELYASSKTDASARRRTRSAKRATRVEAFQRVGQMTATALAVVSDRRDQQRRVLRAKRLAGPEVDGHPDLARLPVEVDDGL
jgi:hypothetical protein